MNNESNPDIGLISGGLRLVVVGPEWASRFTTERCQLSAALGAAAIDIQHIGSTAVAGILAKPILDIAVAIEAFDVGGSSSLPRPSSRVSGTGRTVLRPQAKRCQ